MALALLVTLIGAVTVPTLSLLSQRGLGDLAVLDDGIPVSLLLPIAGVQLFDPGLVTGGYPDAALSGTLDAAVTGGWALALLTLAGFRFVRRDG